MAQNVAKGSIALTIDEAELEASLLFTPDPHGAEWTADKVLRLAMDSRIGGLNQKRAEEIVGKFARSRSAVGEVIAKGQAPEDPVPETVGWADFEAPAELAPLVAEILAAAEPPELYRTTVELVTRERTVTKPAALPFLPPKVEKQKVQEKLEKKERVWPDLELKASGYVRKDAKLGEVYAAKPGKPGKNIFSRPLAASPDPGPFLFGRGIQRGKGSLAAEYDGVLRAGERWAEVIPLARHRWEVEPSGDGASFFLNYQPGHASFPAPSAAEILAACLAKGAPEGSLLPEEAVATAIGEASGSGEPLFSFSLSRDEDAVIDARVSPDGLKALLSLRKGRGHGKPLDLGKLGPALSAAGIKGFNAEKVKKDILEFVKGTESALVDYVLLEGKAPTRGKDRTVNLVLSFLPEEKAAELRSRLLTLPGLAHELPSLAELPLDGETRLAQVKEGQRIAELTAATPGTAGVDIRGQVLPGLPGNDPPLRLHENVDRGRDALSAAITGLLLLTEKEGIQHFRVLPFKDCVIEAGLAPDAMSAWVSLSPESGLGAPLSAESAVAALQAKGVVQGIDARELAAAVAQARAGEVVLRRVVARGRPAVGAGSLRLLWLLGAPGGAPSERQPPPRTRVAAGCPILRLEAGQGGAGQEGLDLLGRPVPPPPPDAGAAPPTHDESIREEAGPEGATTWLAVGAGELLVEGNRVTVRQRLGVAGDVGAATGNLEFAGTVSVQGSVRDGHKLVAGGDVSIGGDVEAALVSSEGSILIRGGIKGGKRGTLRAKRLIEAAFSEQATLLAVEDLRFKGSCLYCNVKTNGRLQLGEQGGALVGGLVRARKGIDVMSLGAENGVKTEVSFGQDYLVRDLIEAEEREIERLKTLIVRADREMAQLQGAGAALDRVRQDKVKLLKLLEKRSLRVFDFREKFEEHFPSEIRVRGTAFPGVILESHNRFFEIRSRKSRVVFTFDPQSGRIVEKSL